MTARCFWRTVAVCASSSALRCTIHDLQVKLLCSGTAHVNMLFRLELDLMQLSIWVFAMELHDKRLLTQRKGKHPIQQDRFVCSTLEHVGCHITQRARQCLAGLHHAWLHVHSLSLTKLVHRLTGTSDTIRALHQVHTAVHTHSVQGIHNMSISI